MCGSNLNPSLTSLAFRVSWNVTKFIDVWKARSLKYAKKNHTKHVYLCHVHKDKIFFINFVCKTLYSNISRTEITLYPFVTSITKKYIPISALDVF
jgi:hypothetical protein